MQYDLQALRMLVDLWARFERVIDFRPVIDEMERNAPEEVDFIHEGRAAERLAALLADRDDVVIPAIYWDRSSRRVLTMDYIDGIKISDVDAQRAAGVNTPQVAESLVDLYNTMILERGMFHADPHPGNLFVVPGDRLRGEGEDRPRRFRPDQDPSRRVPRAADRAHQRDRQRAARGDHRDHGGHGLPHPRPRRGNLLRAWRGLPRRRARSGKSYADQEMVADINERLGTVLRANPLVNVPGDVILIARVMGLLSGLGKMLDSETDLLDALLPYLDPDAEAVAG